MEILEAPIYQKLIKLYKALHLYRSSIPKQDRFTLWQKCENSVIEILDCLLLAAQLPKEQKLTEMEKLSRQLNILRVLLRVAKEVKTIENKKYVNLQMIIDEIGRMLGGWIKSVKNPKENTLGSNEGKRLV